MHGYDRLMCDTSLVNPYVWLRKRGCVSSHTEHEAEELKAHGLELAKLMGVAMRPNKRHHL